MHPIAQKLDIVQLKWYVCAITMIVYEGKAYTIEWYFTDKGKSPVNDFYSSLNKIRRIQLLKLIKYMGDIGQIRNKTKFRNEGNKIYAFKPQPGRFLCFFTKGKKIIITNGFTKKTDKLPSREKSKAERYMKDYLDRVEKDSYYDQN
jgi:phage-related protein